MRQADPLQQRPSALPGSGDRGQALLDLSNRVVKIHKQYYGKGPTKARAHYAQDLVTIVLEGGFTRAELTLRDSGHTRELAAARHAMTQSVESELRATVEEVTGRQVRAYMSANDPSSEIQVEVFVLVREAAEESDAALGSIPRRAGHARAEHREVLDQHRALRAEQVQSREALRRRRDKYSE
jgi:uncharacterized protein YbcI